jgi:hypothetical protein
MGDYEPQTRGLLSLTWVAQQSVTKIIAPSFVNLVTPRAGAKHELLFNKPALDLLILNTYGRFVEQKAHA